MATLTNLISRYVDQRHRVGEFTTYTAGTVTYILNQLDRAHGDRPLDKFGPATIDRWQASIGHLAPATRNLYAAHVRQFCRWLVLRDVIARDPARLLKTVPEPRRTIVTFTHDEVDRLLAVAPDARAVAIIQLMYGAGARCCEVSRIQVPDFDPKAKTVIFTGKGGHERVVPLDDECVAALERYLDQTGRVRGPLIRSELVPHQGLGSKTISIYVRRWIAEAGLKVRPWDGRSPHAIRRTAVSEVAEEAEDPRVAQEFAGHVSLRTTEEHYLRRRSSEDVRRAVEARRRRAA